MIRSVKAARWATFAYFGLNGFVMGTWIVHIPAVEHQARVSAAVLGWLLLLLGLGAFAGMRLIGPVTDRFGARRVVPAGAALCSATLVLPALAGNALILGAALLILGLGNGALDVSMNTHAVQVEARYGRPIMSAFHAVYSVGGLLAALLSARTISWGWSLLATMSAVSVLALAVGAAVATGLLPRPLTAADSSQSCEVGAGGARAVPRRIWALAALALVFMLCEGVANDWSALEARDTLEVSAATAALAYGAFATAMTIGRFLADAVAARVGPVAIVRYGSALAALALTAVALSPWIGLTIVGWGLFGAGLSGVIPQLFSAAGHADPAAAGANVSRVAGVGYLGMLAGPAGIGPLTYLMPLARTFLLPAGLCAIAVLTAAIARPDSTASAATADEWPAASAEDRALIADRNL